MSRPFPLSSEEIRVGLCPAGECVAHRILIERILAVLSVAAEGAEGDRPCSTWAPKLTAGSTKTFTPLSLQSGVALPFIAAWDTCQKQNTSSNKQRINKSAKQRQPRVPSSRQKAESKKHKAVKQQAENKKQQKAKHKTKQKCHHKKQNRSQIIRIPCRIPARSGTAGRVRVPIRRTTTHGPYWLGPLADSGLPAAGFRVVPDPCLSGISGFEARASCSGRASKLLF